MHIELDAAVYSICVDNDVVACVLLLYGTLHNPKVEYMNVLSLTSDTISTS